MLDRARFPEEIEEKEILSIRWVEDIEPASALASLMVYGHYQDRKRAILVLARRIELPGQEE